MADFLLKNPLQIVRLAPAVNPNKGNISTLIGGALPVKVYNAVKAGRSTKEFFGAKWKTIIGQNLDVAEVLGGNDTLSAGDLEKDIMTGIHAVAIEDFIEDVAPEFILGTTEYSEGSETESCRLGVSGGVDLEALLEKQEQLIAPENENAITQENEKIIRHDIDKDEKQEPTRVFSKSHIGFSRPDQPLPKSGTEYEISPVTIFPEDNLEELKQKIYVATGVPVQRQHIFWIDDTGAARTTYRMKTLDGGDVHIDARNLLKDLSKGKSDDLFGLEIDRYMYDNWKEISVIAMDTFKTVEDAILGMASVIFMIDIADVLYNPEILVALANDKAKRDLLFYSVLYKYWPWYPTSEDLLNESNMSSVYPLLAPTREKLIQKFQFETSVLSHISFNEPRKERSLETSITMAIVSVSTGARVNIRNLFDKLETSKNIPHINAYITDGALRFNLVKHQIGTPFTQFPNQTRSAITMAIPISPDEIISQSIVESQTGSKMANIFLNIQANGIYYMLCHFSEDAKIDFDALIELLITRVNPVIAEVNKFADYIFMSSIRQLAPISRINARYPDINVILNWKRATSEGDFKVLKKAWEPYEMAGILAAKPISFGTNQNIMMEMSFYKGCVEYDVGQIARSSVLNEIKNYYSHLTNPTVNSVWNNMYKGRTVRMYQRTSDIQFEIFNATQNNFLRFRKYLDGFLTQVIHDNVLSNRPVKSKHIKKLKALQETDPELYDLRRHGSTRLYTVSCQEPRQPLIFSRRDDAPRGAIEYINHTTNQPAYYYCDNKIHPILSFITGVHPLGYCLPCCKKKQAALTSEKYQEDQTCFESGEAKPREVVDVGKLTSDSSHHIMVYGKELPKYRLGFIPKDISDYLLSVGVVDVENAYIYGVVQDYPGAPASTGAGALGALAMTIQMKPEQLATTFVKHIKLMGIGYESLMNGEIIEWFESLDSLIGTISTVFIQQEFVVLHFNRWLELFSELFRLIKNTEVIVFDNGYIEYSGVARDVAAILIKNEDLIYPLVRVELSEYYRNNIIKYRLFEDAQLITEPISVKVRASTTDEINMMNLLAAELEKTKFKVAITPQRVAYGVIADGIFITFKSTYIPSDFESYEDVPKEGKHKESLTLLNKVKRKIAGSEIIDDKKYSKIILVRGAEKLAIAHYRGDKDLWSAIIKMEPPKDKFDELLPIAISKHNSYNLLLMEFTAVADKHKNTPLRKLIRGLVDKLNINDADSLHEFTGTLKKNIDNPNDIGVINSIVAQNVGKKARINEIIDSKKFNFDKNNYYQMANMPINELTQEIEKFIKQYVILDKDIPPPPKNLTLPGQKLRIHGESVKDMVELLVADLQNPLKLELMKSGALSSYLLLDVFDFERRPNETIKIIQI